MNRSTTDSLYHCGGCNYCVSGTSANRVDEAGQRLGCVLTTVCHTNVGFLDFLRRLLFRNRSSCRNGLFLFECDTTNTVQNTSNDSYGGHCTDIPVSFIKVPLLNSSTYFLNSIDMATLQTSHYSEFYDRMTVHRNRFLVNKTNRCTEFQIYWYYGVTCFGQPFCPSSGVLSRTSALVHFMQL
jgi:hypothetical protein